MIGYCIDKTVIGFSRFAMKNLSMRHFGKDSVENP